MQDAGPTQGPACSTERLASVTPSAPATAPRHDPVPWLDCVPFFGMHLAALSAFFVDFHARDIALCVALYYGRMLFLTMVYHRYFSHRSFKTSRWFQFVLAFLGSLSVQKGVLWWAAHHRHHHRFSDQQEDVHSPIQRGF